MAQTHGVRPLSGPQSAEDLQVSLPKESTFRKTTNNPEIWIEPAGKRFNLTRAQDPTRCRCSTTCLLPLANASLQASDWCEGKQTRNEKKQASLWQHIKCSTTDTHLISAALRNIRSQLKQLWQNKNKPRIKLTGLYFRQNVFELMEFKHFILVNLTHVEIF